jgi:HAD superfamily hydrolase (TIGR01509 family)
MSHAPTPPYGLLLDLDGTIADTLPHLFRAFRHGVEPFVTQLPSDAEIVATFGPPERDCIAKVLRNPELAAPAAIAGLDAAEERFHAYYEGRHEEVKAFPGIADVMRLARARDWRIGVCTGKGRRSAVFTLQLLELLQYVECLVTGEDVRRPKPDPEGVRLVMQQLGVQGEHLIVVGDTPADVLAGQAAGARTAGAFWGAFDSEALRRAGPTWALATVNDLRRLIEQGA